MSVGDKDIAVFCFGYGKIVCTVAAVAVAGNRDYRYIEFCFQFIGIALHVSCMYYHIYALEMRVYFSYLVQMTVCISDDK